MTSRKTIVVTLLSALGVIALFFIYPQRYHTGKNLSNIPAQAKALAATHDIETGDIIFQTSLSTQSKAIQQATNSIYSHCGIIFKQDNKLYVYEAVQPVKITPLDKWIARGEGGHFVIKRLKNAQAILTPAVLNNMQKTGAAFIGKNYDAYFEWADERIYCSELIWKIYNRATGLSIGQLQQLKDFNLSTPAVKQKLAERYGNNVPLDETVISPASIFNSNLLATVMSN
jgi:uncharacterized protein YycO